MRCRGQSVTRCICQQRRPREWPRGESSIGVTTKAKACSLAVGWSHRAFPLVKDDSSAKHVCVRRNKLVIKVPVVLRRRGPVIASHPGTLYASDRFPITARAALAAAGLIALKETSIAAGLGVGVGVTEGRGFGVGVGALHPKLEARSWPDSRRSPLMQCAMTYYQSSRKQSRGGPRHRMLRAHQQLHLL